MESLHPVIEIRLVMILLFILHQTERLMGLLITTQCKTSGLCFSNLVYFVDVYPKPDTRYSEFAFLCETLVYTGRESKY